MQQVFYIHGGGSYSNYDDYINHLKTCTLRQPHGDKPELWGKRLRDFLPTHELFTPAMPNSTDAKYEEWKIWFERHFEYLKDDVILLGWSLGALFFEKYLLENELPFSPKALILVSPPALYFKDEQSGEDGGDFNFDYTTVGNLSSRVRNIHIFHSKDDFVVPYEHAEALQAALPEATLHSFEDRNHFLQEDFPELIALIEEL